MACQTVVVYGSGQDWVDDLIRAFNAHDAVAVGAFMTADAEYRCWLDESWVTVQGRDAVVGMLDSFDKEMSSDFSLEKKFAVVTSEGFAVEYIEVGTQDRGSAPTGGTFNLHNVMVGELRSGMISRMTDYSDVIAYRRQSSSVDPG